MQKLIEHISELLYLRRKELEQNEPYATRTIATLESAEHEVFDLIDYVSELEDK